MSIENPTERLTIVRKLFVAFGIADLERLKVYVEASQRMPLEWLARAVAEVLTKREQVSLPPVGALLETGRELWRCHRRERHEQWVANNRERIAARVHELQSERLGPWLSSGEAFERAIRDVQMEHVSLAEHAS